MFSGAWQVVKQARWAMVNWGTHTPSKGHPCLEAARFPWRLYSLCLHTSRRAGHSEALAFNPTLLSSVVLLDLAQPNFCLNSSSPPLWYQSIL